MDILKTPHEKLMEEAGVLPASNGWLSTPNQMLMQEAGITPHLASGGQPQISPADMEAALLVNGRVPPRFQYAEGGRVNASFSHEEFMKLHPLFVALGLINPDDNIKYSK